MKKVIFLTIIFSVFFSVNSIYAASTTDGLKNLPPLHKQIRKIAIEPALRALKLANSHRELKHYKEAEGYLDLALEQIKQLGNKYVYWEAVSYEFYAYLYRDMNEQEQAIKYAKKAKRIFDKVIDDMSDEMSPSTIEEWIKQLKGDDVSDNTVNKNVKNETLQSNSKVNDIEIKIKNMEQKLDLIAQYLDKKNKK